MRMAGPRRGQQQHDDRGERDHARQLPHADPGEHQDRDEARDGGRQRHQVPEQPATGPPGQRAIVPAGQHDILARGGGGQDGLAAKPCAVDLLSRQARAALKMLRISDRMVITSTANSAILGL